MAEAPIAQRVHPAARLAMFAALSERNYRWYWLGLMLYVIAGKVEYVTFGWQIWALTHDPLYLGYFGLAEGVPLVLFQVFGGVLADRTQRLRLLVGTQCVSAAILLTAFVLTATGLVRVEHLLGLTVLSGTFRAFEQPTRMALIPQLVTRERLPNAIALGSIPWQSGRILGPSVAGVLIWVFDAAAGFALAALAQCLAIAFYTRIRLPAEALADRGHSVLQNVLDGFAFVARHSLFSSLIALTFFNSLFGMSYVTLLPIFADRYLGTGSSGYGLMQAASGLGAVVGTLTIASAATRLRHRGVILLAGGAGFGVLLAAFSQAPTFALALAILTVMGFSNTFYNTLVNTVLQENVPNELRGRVMGLYGLCWNLIPLGGILGGALAAAVDARFAVLVGGAMVAAMALLILAFGRRLRAIQ